MAITDLNIDLEEETDYTLSIVYTDDKTNLPRDLTGYLAYFTIRRETAGEVVLLVTSKAGGGITLGGTDGTIDVRILDTDLTFTSHPPFWRTGIYDLVVMNTAGIKTKLAQGFVTLTPTSSLNVVV
jgi:hypothetical protein